MGFYPAPQNFYAAHARYLFAAFVPACALPLLTAARSGLIIYRAYNIRVSKTIFTGDVA